MEDSLLVKPHPTAEECEVVGVVEVVDVVVVAVAVDTFLVAASPQLAQGLVTTDRGGLPVNIIVLGFILQATVEGEGPRAGPPDQVVLEGVLAGVFHGVRLTRTLLTAKSRVRQGWVRFPGRLGSSSPSRDTK